MQAVDTVYDMRREKLPMLYNAQKYIRTDLAAEFPRDADHTIERGFTIEESTNASVRITRIHVYNDAGAHQVGKPIGHYITLSFERPWLLEQKRQREIIAALSDELLKRFSDLPANPSSILAIGLGNREITADAIGPKTIDQIEVTRHLQTMCPALYEQIAKHEVSAIAPGVLGQTGIETLELIRGITNHVKPDVILAIDALAARHVDRLAMTIQIADTGIAPGAGIGNHRQALNAETLGVPVLAIGVPTVVDSSTLVCNALEKANIHEISDSLEEVLNNGKSFFVSLKETDAAVQMLSRILAASINMVCSNLEDVNFALQ